MSRSFKPYPFTPRHYAGVVPPLGDGCDPQRRAVAIVGGGPVGMTLALALARQGVRSVLIEADDGVCTGSRAICISRRSLEIFKRLGVVQGFLQKGLPWTRGRSFYRNAEVFRFAMHQDDEQSLPPMINIAQYQIEQLLLDEVEQHADLIEIRWQTRVTGIERHTGNGATGATLDLSTGDTAWKMRTDWVVACDGGRSTIREALGLKLTGTTYEGRYVIVDIELESERATERLAYFGPPSNPGSTVLVHKQPDNVWRIDYQLRDDEDPEAAVKPENVMPRVQSVLDSMGETGEWSPIWITVYKANALTLERYRHGSVLFAGDAAHLVPIFGVRGANSGIDDADNLGWKLGCVVNGIASDRLLDSYSDERVFAARENLSYGMKSTEFMAPPSFAFDLMRQAVLGLATHHPAVRPLINPRQTHAIAYAESPLNRVAVAASDAFAKGPAPGTVLPECRLQRTCDGVPVDIHLTDLLGPCFTALRFGADTAQDEAWQQLHHALGEHRIPFKAITLVTGDAPRVTSPHVVDPAGRLHEMLDATPGTVYLIRPDGHVLARWRNGNATDVQSAVTASLTN
ncbi:FAD-dependent oxidoreductase [Paraburkholderia nemoris]|uniref:3-(3-hydroxy-phenyl)propionate/3-hydroxycinnamic acid hydroxylase n=1 Tax=Paraburkholderia nemoris TaxID=2793076 RepID=A0ABN7L241_9BURK|nr:MULTISPECIES: FAD-dependent oxidoreductase [Paraburkholderia]MBK3810222.1 FAD-dependent oxidoreductase [Paraburkholderia aspalathi]CAE6726504.1 3-(3-hydroxy-phenyl)propionate/3-hydroxycinnamic acid hydroxylase [Paraburkholderia nemoris]CAE6746650.1 3-(3-hydroxy-phenyl)propionate/3-hydroxycinnamic acid hydroxylase [Paraburkholderia nemoris]